MLHLPQKTVAKRLLTSFVTKASLYSLAPGKLSRILRFKKKRNKGNIYHTQVFFWHVRGVHRLHFFVCICVQSYLLPLQLSRLCCPILKLFWVLLPDGEDPFIISRVIASRCLAVWLPIMSQNGEDLIGCTSCYMLP